MIVVLHSVLINFFPFKQILLASSQANHLFLSLFNSNCMKLVDAEEGYVLLLNVRLVWMEIISQVI